MLTVTQVKNLKDDILTDTVPYRGLRVKDSSAGKSFFYRYRNVMGNVRQQKLGTYPSMSLADARAAVVEFQQMRRDGKDPKQERQKVIDRTLAAEKEVQWKEHKQSYLVQDMVGHYLDEHIEKNRNYKGGKEVRRVFERDALPILGQIPAAELRRSHIHNLVVTLPASIGRDVKREVRAAFEHGIAAGRIPEELRNPADKIKVQRQKSRKRVFSEEELRVFMKWLPTAPVSDNVRDGWELSLLTGCRSGEIVAMEWTDLDFKTGTWNLTKTKTDVPRIVQLSKQAVEVIRRVEPDGKYRFHRRREKIQQKVFSVAMYHCKDELPFAGWTTHDLRRTCRTMLSRLGCPDVVGESILGHSRSGIQGVYDLHRYENDCKEWLQRWADWLDELKKEPVEPGTDMQLIAQSN